MKFALAPCDAIRTVLVGLCLAGGIGAGPACAEPVGRTVAVRNADRVVAEGSENVSNRSGGRARSTSKQESEKRSEPAGPDVQEAIKRHYEVVGELMSHPRALAAECK